MSVEMWRVVQDQESYYQKIGDLDYEEAQALNLLLESSKPGLSGHQEDWDELIYTPFRYPLPVGLNFGSRFKPPNSDYHLLYSSKERETSFAETAHHFLREREHLQNLEDEIVKKTSFSLELLSLTKFKDISKDPNLKKIMNDDYSESFFWASTIINKINGIIYPSARLEGGTNIAVKEISSLGKNIRGKESIAYKFFSKTRHVEIYQYLGKKLFEYEKRNVFY